MSLGNITGNMKARVGNDCGIPKVIKFDFGNDGKVRIDGTVKPNVVDNLDSPADCTIRIGMSDFLDISAGRRNAQMAFMMGRLRVEGDMGIALQLGKIIG